MFVQSQSWREATDCGPETGLRPAPCAEAEAPTLPVGEQIYSTNKALLFLSKSSACGSPRFQHSQLVSGMWKCSAMGLANPCRVDLVINTVCVCVCVCDSMSAIIIIIRYITHHHKAHIPAKNTLITERCKKMTASGRGRAIAPV